MSAFDASYYERNRQAEDRPALWFYARLASRWLAPGPVLDFGCGTGFLLRRMSRCMPVAGLEHSEYCRQKLKDDLPGVRVYDGVDSLPKAAFSGVVALHVFEHIPDPDLADILRTFHGALQPGGRLMCVMPDTAGRGQRLKGERWSGYMDPTHVNLKSAEQWQEFLSGHGFRVIRSGTDGLWDFPYRRGWPVCFDFLRYAWGTGFQFLLGRLVLPAGSGESVILLLQRDN